MNRSLKRLIELEPPPKLPVAPGAPSDWSRVEAEIGIGLPQDFKDYVEAYGAGQWADFFGVMNPFYKWKHPDAQQSWSQWMNMRMGSLAEFRREHPKETAPFQAYPAKDGLLAFGYDDNGGTLCWQTTGDPKSWAIVCLDEGFSKDFDRFDLPLTAFIAGLLTEEIFPKTFAPDIFPISKPAFKAYTTE
jgi:hypothetical protein